MTALLVDPRPDAPGSAQPDRPPNLPWDIEVGRHYVVDPDTGLAIPWNPCLPPPSGWDRDGWRGDGNAVVDRQGRRQRPRKFEPTRTERRRMRGQRRPDFEGDEQSRRTRR